MKYDVHTPATLKASDTPIDVNGNITPSTHERVGQIQEDKWMDPNVSLEFLNGQMEILNKRLAYACQMHQPAMMTFINQGIARLNHAINKKIETQD